MALGNSIAAVASHAGGFRRKVLNKLEGLDHSPKPDVGQGRQFVSSCPTKFVAKEIDWNASGHETEASFFSNEVHSDHSVAYRDTARANRVKRLSSAEEAKSRESSSFETVQRPSKPGTLSSFAF